MQGIKLAHYRSRARIVREQDGHAGAKKRRPLQAVRASHSVAPRN